MKNYTVTDRPTNTKYALRVISVTKNRKKSVLAGINYPGAKNSRRVKNQFYKTRRISNLFVCCTRGTTKKTDTAENSADIRIQY